MILNALLNHDLFTGFLKRHYGLAWRQCAKRREIRVEYIQDVPITLITWNIGTSCILLKTILRAISAYALELFCIVLAIHRSSSRVIAVRRCSQVSPNRNLLLNTNLRILVPGNVRNVQATYFVPRYPVLFCGVPCHPISFHVDCYTHDAIFACLTAFNGSYKSFRFTRRTNWASCTKTWSPWIKLLEQRNIRMMISLNKSENK